jgi:predicted metal-dependent peptidase
MSDEGVTLEPSDAPAILPCGLTEKQLEAWNSTTSMMVWTCPGFQHLWYKLLNNHGGEYTGLMTKSVPIAATDGKNIMVNPDTFFEYDLRGRTFIMAHEVIHNVYDDVNLLHACSKRGLVPMNDGKELPFRNDIMQKAMDLRINALLVKSKIGAPPKDKNGKVVGHFDPEMTGEESVLDTYKKVYEEESDTPEGGNNPGGFDNVASPGTSTGQKPDQAAQQRNPQQWATEVAAAQIIEASRSQGKMAAAMKRFFEKLLEPEVNWVDHITTLINRVTGSGGWNWKQPDEWWTPHDFFSPKRTGRGAGWIVVWGDTSGSRDDQQIASSIGELSGILSDVNPARLTVLWGDAEIANIEELSEASDLKKLDPRGGGGTDVDPCYQWIMEQDQPPDLFIGFTDGYLSFPPPPRGVPIIWASSTDEEYPYGSVVRVNRKPQRA